MSLLMVACGDTPPAVAEPSAPPRHDLRFAVLQDAGAAAGQPAQDRLLIIDPTAKTSASLTFAAPPRPPIGNAATLIGFPVVAAAGRAYYIDGTGTVRTLGPDGDKTTVAHFPITGDRQQISFAVNPKSGVVDALRLTHAAYDRGCNPEAGPTCGEQPGPYHYSVFSSHAGAVTTLVDEQAVPTTDAGFVAAAPQLLAWPRAGPVVLTDAPVGTQNGTPGRDGGPRGHGLVLKDDGTYGTAVGGANCRIWDVGATNVVCDSGDVQTPRVEVRDATGTTVESLNLDVGCLGCAATASWLRLGPDGNTVAGRLSQIPAGGGSEKSTSFVFRPDGTAVSLATDFVPQGWLDAITLIGTIASANPDPNCSGFGGGQLATLSLRIPLDAHRLNVCGTFAGLVAAAS